MIDWKPQPVENTGDVLVGMWCGLAFVVMVSTSALFMMYVIKSAI